MQRNNELRRRGGVLRKKRDLRYTFRLARDHAGFLFLKTRCYRCAFMLYSRSYLNRWIINRVQGSAARHS